jgi:hypothetical protein
MSNPTMPHRQRHVNRRARCVTANRPPRPRRRTTPDLEGRDGPLAHACGQLAELATDLAVAARRHPTPGAVRAAVSAERAAMALHQLNSVLADLVSRDRDHDDDDERRAA